MVQGQGECACAEQLKQKLKPQRHSTSQYRSPAPTRIARPQCGALGHHFTESLSSR
uniref:Uncharacterized protein n=1 Tax=Arundo donax TaxID=35708 RepID=A0A0A8Y7G2_ARUDO